MRPIDIKSYHKSISEEFKIYQNGVRNIIGRAHWGEVGKYKEVILMNILRRFEYQRSLYSIEKRRF